MNKKLVPTVFRDNFITSADTLFDSILAKTFPEFGEDFGVTFFEKNSYPKVDVIDDEGKIQIVAEIPGLDKSDIDIDVSNNLLTISGKKTVSSDKKDKTYLLKELKHSSFKRSFQLNDTLDTDKINAAFENGILNIDIPKKVIEKKEKKMIEIK